MLVTKKPSKGDIVAIKTVSGEELIARIQEISNTDYTLKTPLAVTPRPVVHEGKQQMSLGFLPFMLTAVDTGEIDLPRSAIVAVAYANDGVKKMYIQATSGIVPAGPGDASKLITGI